MREKLIELLEHDNCPLFMVFGDNVGLLADYLIAHGVTIQTEAENPKTNGDRIRAMTDEELALFLAEKYANASVLRLQDGGQEPTATEIKALTNMLRKTWMRWLKQPAEG